MTIQELNRVRELEIGIEDLKRQISKARAKATSTTSSQWVRGKDKKQDGSEEGYSALRSMPHAPGVSDKVGDGASEAADLLHTLRKIKRQRTVELKRLLDYIEHVDDPMVQRIMLHRFVHGKSWANTAIEIGGGNTEEGVKMACYRYIKNHSDEDD